MEVELKREQDLAKLSVLTPGVTTSLQDFCSLALESLKSYKPEIKRLETKSDDIARVVNENQASTRLALDAHEVSRSALDRRTAAMEERLNKFEALVSVLPVWKEDLVVRIESVAKENRARAEQLAMRQQNMEDQHHQHVQLTRERIDSLSDVMRTLAIARQTHSERMDALERQLRNTEESTKKKLEELEIASKRHDVEILSNARKLTELGIGLSVARVDVESLRDRMTQAEGDIQANRSDLLVMQDRQNLFHKAMMVMEKQIKEQEMSAEIQSERILKLENDTRIPDLQAIAHDYQHFKGKVSSFMDKTDKLYEGLEDKYNKLDNKVELGPPGLWKLTAQVAAQAEEISAMQATLRENGHAALQLERALADLRLQMGSAQRALEAADKEAQDLSARLAAEVKRLIEYTDSRVEHLAAKYEVEAVRNTVSSVQAELEKAINAMGLRVKFELLHDEMPQVNTIKAYMNQLEYGMARAQERMACLEEGLHHETTRGGCLEAQWKATKATLDALILDGDLDVHAMRREVTRIKKTLEELGKLACKGEILTLQEASSLVDAKLHSPSMDALLHKKIIANAVFKQELSHLAPRHELDALKRMVLDAQQELIRLQVQRPPAPGHATHTIPTSATPGHASGGHASPGAPPTTHTTSLARASSADARLPPHAMEFGESVGGGEAGALLAVYAKLAGVEEALARNGALGLALNERLQANEQQLQAMDIQVSAELPAVKEQVAALLGLLGVPRGPHAGPPAAAAAAGGLGQAQTPAQLEPAVRSVLNRTLLPELVERQALEARRLVRFVESCLAGTARMHDLDALRRTVEQLRAEAAATRASSSSSSSGGQEGTACGGAGKGGEAGQRGASSGSSSGEDEGEAAGAAGAGVRDGKGCGEEEGEPVQGAPGAQRGEGAGGDGQGEGEASGGRAEGRSLDGDASADTGGSAANAGGSTKATAAVASATVAPAAGGEALGLGPAGEGGADGRAGGAGSLGSTAGEAAAGGEGPEGEQPGRMRGSLSGSAAAVEGLDPPIDGPPSLAHHATLLRVLEARLGGLEGEVQRLAQQPHAPSSTQPQLQLPPPPQQAQELQELRVGLQDMRVQLPLLARAYEVEGLRRAVLDTRDALAARAGAAPPAMAAPLNLTITLLQQQPWQPPRPTSADQQQQQQQQQGDEVDSDGLESQGEGGAAADAAQAGAHPLMFTQKPAAINPEAGPSGSAASQGPGAHSAAAPEAHDDASSAGSVDPGAAADTDAPVQGQAAGGEEGPQGQEDPGSGGAPRQQQLEGQVGPGQAAGAVAVLSVSGDEVEMVLEALQGLKAAHMAQAAQALSRLSKLEVAMGVSEERARTLDELCAAASKRAASALASLEQALPRLEQQVAQALDAGGRASAAAASALASTTEAKHAAATTLATVQALQKQQAATPGGAPLIPPRPQHPFHQFGNEQAFDAALRNSAALPEIVQEIVAGAGREDYLVLDADSDSTPPSSPLALGASTHKLRGAPLETVAMPLERQASNEGSLISSGLARPFSSQSLPPLMEGTPHGGSALGADRGRPTSPLRSPRSLQPRMWSAGSAAGLPARAPRPQRAGSPYAGSRWLPQQSMARKPLHRVLSSQHSGRDSPAGLPYGFGQQGVPRHLHTAEHADTELSGVLHDLMFAVHAELRATGGGPLPGNPLGTLSQAALREAAVRRLGAQPFECQKHVELLENAKKELDRLVNNAAVSTVDYIALVCIMNDMRLKLLEDTAEQQREQMTVAYRNLETVFEYLKHIQVAVNNKASALALMHVDKCLRGVGREMILMGKPPEVVGGRHEAAGLLYGLALGSSEFWAPFMRGSGPNDMTGARFGSPPRPGSTMPTGRTLSTLPPRLSGNSKAMSLPSSRNSPRSPRNHTKSSLSPLLEPNSRRPATAGPRLLLAPLQETPGAPDHSTPLQQYPSSPALNTIPSPSVPLSRPSTGRRQPPKYPPPNFQHAKRDLLEEHERMQQMDPLQRLLQEQLPPHLAGGGPQLLPRARPSTARPS